MEEDEITFALGHMVREAASVELRLGMIGQFLCESPYGGMLVVGESTSRLIDVCKALVMAHEEIPEEQQNALKELLSASRTRFEERHQYIHGAWATDGETQELLTLRTRRLRRQPQFEAMSSEKIEELAEAFGDLDARLNDWLMCRLSPTYEPGSILRLRELTGDPATGRKISRR